jgi:radical SAM protein with 4Fe4S-binding SPASM domain
LNPSAYGVKSCQKRTGVVSIYYDGTITSCDLTLKVGSVRELDFDLRKLWQSDRFVAFDSKFREFGNFHPACDGCSLMNHQRRPLKAEQGSK